MQCRARSAIRSRRFANTLRRYAASVSFSTTWGQRCLRDLARMVATPIPERAAHAVRRRLGFVPRRGHISDRDLPCIRPGCPCSNRNGALISSSPPQPACAWRTPGPSPRPRPASSGPSGSGAAGSRRRNRSSGIGRPGSGPRCSRYAG
jgi:hypothetical protein